METINGVITRYDEKGNIVVEAVYNNIDRFIKRQYKEAVIVLKDGRMITSEQRRKAYALLGEIADYMGEMPEYVKKLFKLKFIHDQMTELANDIFSLSSCDITTASEFISYLVEFIIYHDIPTKVPLVELCEDVTKYVYACALNKKCAVCGRKAELHHVDTVGANGGNRDKINHLGLRALPLCRKHHGEAHDLGAEEFMKRHYLKAIRLNEKLCKKWRLKYDSK